MASDNPHPRTSHTDPALTPSDETVARAPIQLTIHHVGLAALFLAGVIGLIACARVANTKGSVSYQFGESTFDLAIGGTLVALVAGLPLSLITLIVAFASFYLGFSLRKPAFVVTAYALLAMCLLFAMLSAAEIGRTGFAH